MAIPEGVGSQGVTAWGDFGGDYLINKPLHRNVLKPTPWEGNLRRGMIRAHSEYPGAQKGAFRFHFNPTTIEVSYAQFAGDLLAEEVFRSTGEGTGLLVGAYTVSWALLLNRQYDVIQDPNSRGTLDDIDVLMALVGYAGFVSQRPIAVVFGKDFAVDGVINNLQVGHHQFTSQMIPVYSTINISITNMPSGDGGTGSSITPNTYQGGSTSLHPNIPEN